MEADLLVVLMQDLGDVVLQGPELLVDVMEEVVQVGFVKLTALDQHLRVESRTVNQSFTSGCVMAVLCPLKRSRPDGMRGQ